MGQSRNNPFEAGDVAVNYRRYLQPWLFEPWAELLVAGAGVRPGDTVLDVASGTGVVARAAAKAAGGQGRVIASDISASMLDHVTIGAVVDGTRAPIETSVGSALALDLPDASIDVVLCQQGLQFMPDRVAAAREMLRVLRPGGVAAIAVWAEGVKLVPLDDFAEALNDNGAESDFGHRVTNDSLTMTPEDLAAILHRAGFRSVDARLERLTIRWDSLDDEVNSILGTPFGPTVAAMDAPRRARLMEALHRQLAGPDGKPGDHHTASAVAIATKARATLT